ncbi:MAG: DNA polymerase III subunit delta [Thermaurantimonas sp.]|uniref:DNA polymerase III subunit delta n=1 Tax=Thermaurantimonas sp. TaxID=2681568 RepID=UPI00391B9C0E
MDFEKIKKDILDKQLSNFYLLHGEEPYFVDQLTHFIEHTILQPEERDFNQMVLYGAETSVQRIIEEAKQFPFGAPYRVVIVKEAQELLNIEQLRAYLENPNPQAILVISAKGEKIDGRLAIVQLAKKKFVEFYSPKIKDYQMPAFIQEYLRSQGIQADKHVCDMIYEGVGTEISVLANEVRKIRLYFGKDNIHLKAEDVEKLIGVNREFNAFELSNAVMQRNFEKAARIVHFFKKNPKQHPAIPIVAGIFNSFYQLYAIYLANIQSESQAAEMLKLHPYVAKNLMGYKRNFSEEDCEMAILYCTRCDARIKGVNNHSTDAFDEIFDLIYRLTHKYWW